MKTAEHKLLPKNLLSALVHPWVWQMAWRDSRSQRMRLLIFSLAVVAGVAGLTAIYSLKKSVESGVLSEAKSLLGADLKISSKSVIDEQDIKKISTLAEKYGREISFPTMMRFQPDQPDGGSRLMQMRGIEGGYPFYGNIQTRPANVWQSIQSKKYENGVLLEPAVLDQFGVKIGDEVKVGDIKLKILGVVDRPAPRGNRFSGFAPEAYLHLDDLEISGLLGARSMANFAVLLKIADEGIADNSGDEIKADIEKEFPDSQWRLETPEDRRENLGDALDNLQQFLGLIALASLVLGAIGVAGAVHAHVTKRIATIAILRCLGCSTNLAFAVYLAQATVLGALGASLGAALGMGIHIVSLTVFEEQIPIAVSIIPEWQVALQTSIMGFVVCCGFAVQPLLKIRNISPSETLRNEVRQRSRIAKMIPVYMVLLGLLSLVAYGNSPSWVSAVAVILGISLAFLALIAVANGLMWVARHLVKRQKSYLLRQGVSNLYRPGNQTILFMLSLGLGTFLLVTIISVSNLLDDRLSIRNAANSPNLYLIDVQPDQISGVKEILELNGLPILESAPMVSMRIESIRGIPIGDIDAIPKWVARREFRSTYRDYLNPTETLIAGKLSKKWDDPAKPVPISMEQKIASDLGLTIGDNLTIDVQGLSIEAQVTSLRSVDWSRFNLNFFMIFPPGVLEDAPGFNVLTTVTESAAASGDLQRDIADSYANVTAIDLTQILQSVRAILEKISAVISLLAGLSLLAGVPILIGMFLNGRDVRLKESMLLRTIGASARQIRMILLIEYCALGVLSAMTGILLAYAAHVSLAIFVFKAAPSFNLAMVTIPLALVTGISVIGGFVLSRGITNSIPMKILRSS